MSIAPRLSSDEANNTLAALRPSTLSNIAWSGLGQALGLAFASASSVLLARSLGLAGRGMYALIVTTASNLTDILAGSALSAAAVYLTARTSGPTARVVGQVVLVACINLLALGAAWGVIPVSRISESLGGLDKMGLWLAAGLTIPFMMRSLLPGILLGLDRVRLLASLNVFFEAVTMLLLAVLLGFLGMGFAGAQWQLVITGAIVIGTGLVVLTSCVGMDLRPDRRLLGAVTQFAGRLYPGSVGLILLVQADTYFVAAFSGVSAVGAYAVAKGLNTVISMLEPPIEQGLIPKVAAWQHDDAVAALCRVFRWLLWLSFGVTGVGACLSRFLITRLYGLDYEKSVSIFLVLLASNLSMAHRPLYTYFSYQLGRPGLCTVFTLASGLFSLPVYYMMSQRFGYLGTAAAFTLVITVTGVAVTMTFLALTRVRVTELVIPRREDWLAVRALVARQIAFLQRWAEP